MKFLREIQQALRRARRLTAPAQMQAIAQGYHPECAACCAIGRCHWCLTSGVALITQEHGRHRYHACVAHAQMFRAALEVASLDPKDFPRTPRMDGHVRLAAAVTMPAVLSR